MGGGRKVGRERGRDRKRGREIERDSEREGGRYIRRKNGKEVGRGGNEIEREGER